jgi:phospholipid/cholesterol/gamma-HCH transport system permease protein
MLELFDDVGSRILEVIELAGYCAILFFEMIPFVPKIWEKRGDIIDQMYVGGVKSFLVNVVVALFTGMILALQTGLALKDFGQETMVGRLVAITLTREMSPFISAIVLIASVGSAIAAEIATMKVSEEIDALEMMSISPVKYLVMPRVLALALIFPLSAVFFTFVGMFGGAVVAFYKLNIPWAMYYNDAMQGLHFKATYVGLLKSHIFGIVVALICCSYGLRAKNGVIGVGQATRSSVISSFMMVLILGYFITAMFFG